MINIYSKLDGMSPGTLRLISKEVKGDLPFQNRLRQLLEQPDPQKAVFQDMLEAIRVHVSGAELPAWLWWNLIDEVERFTLDVAYFPQPGDEAALLHRVLAALSIEAAVENKAAKNLPWKTYAPTTASSGMGVQWFKSQKNRRKRKRRNKMLSRMTPEKRAAWLALWKARKEKRKRKSLGKKFNRAFDKYGGYAGGVMTAVGGCIVLIAPWGTVIGAALIVGGTAITLVQKQNLARYAAAARKRELQQIQDDFDSGEITEAEQTEAVRGIMVEEAEKLAAKGQLPPAEAVPEVPIATTPEEAKEVIADIVFKDKVPGQIVVPAKDAAILVNKENQYVIAQAVKMTEGEVQPVGLAPARSIAITQKRTKQVAGGAAAMMAAAVAVPFVI